MRWRLVGSFLLVIIIALGTVALVTRYATEQEVQRFIGYGGQVGLENLASSLETHYAQNGSWTGVELVFQAGEGRGRGPRSNANVGISNHVLADETGVILHSPVPSEVGTKVSESTLSQSIPLKVSGNVVGYIVPEGGGLELPDNFEGLLIDRVNQASLVAALISGGLAVLLALLLAGLMLKPVRILTGAAENMASGDLSQRVAVQGKGELARLGDAFNQMASSLQGAAKQRQMLTADIAHELRNPLAIQRAHLEALQDGVYPLNQENLGLIAQQNQQLTRLVEDLRTLALADAGELVLNKRPVDLSDICKETLTRFEPQAQRKNIQLTADCLSEGLTISADKERLQQVQDNLMQNALRYTPEGGIIKLTLLTSGDHAVLEIYNNGPKMPDEVLGCLFERFYRGDKARDRASGGTGLGLAIARKLVEGHGGSLTADNHADGGVVFTIRLLKL